MFLSRIIIRSVSEQSTAFFQKMSSMTNGSTFVEAHMEIRDDHREATLEETERRAHQLRQEGQAILDQTAEKMLQAQRAQAAAAAMAEQANRITEEALTQQVHGQEKLAAAAQKMMEAGARMQQEASSITVTEVPYNLHETAEVRQATATVGQEVRDLKQELHVTREATNLTTTGQTGVATGGFAHHETTKSKGQGGQFHGSEKFESKTEQHPKHR
jgi:hypothetical protein